LEQDRIRQELQRKAQEEAERKEQEERLAAAVIALLIWLCYRWSDRISTLLGQSGARVMSRLVAFLLLCVGVQIIVTGVVGVAGMIGAPR
jgi:multiple antibiotic resistance protein